ncbi:hypothetical protein Brsp05_04118 [Brucella sp. NBRC 12953]|uniref:hypothetical protein n=1 Tax=Brucella sp. NBRC 12953 TaxID=3075481 RepID=UPI00309EC8BA
MPEHDAVTAYLANDEEMLAVTARSVVLEFPGGETIEICWEPPLAGDCRPLAIEIWGGRRLPRDDSAEPDERITTLSLSPSAANLVLVRPHCHPRGQAGARQPDLAIPSTGSKVAPDRDLLFEQSKEFSHHGMGATDRAGRQG